MSADTDADAFLPRSPTFICWGCKFLLPSFLFLDSSSCGLRVFRIPCSEKWPLESELESECFGVVVLVLVLVLVGISGEWSLTLFLVVATPHCLSESVLTLSLSFSRHHLPFQLVISGPQSGLRSSSSLSSSVDRHQLFLRCCWEQFTTQLRTGQPRLSSPEAVKSVPGRVGHFIVDTTVDLCSRYLISLTASALLFCYSVTLSG